MGKKANQGRSKQKAAVADRCYHGYGPGASARDLARC